MVVTDSRGKVIQQAAMLAELQRYFEAGNDPAQPASIGWGYKVDGKRLAQASFPVVVKVMVEDRDGGKGRGVPHRQPLSDLTAPFR